MASLCQYSGRDRLDTVAIQQDKRFTELDAKMKDAMLAVLEGSIYHHYNSTKVDLSNMRQ